MVIKRSQIPEFIKRVTPNRIFHVDFIKKTTGEVRHMNCRIHVTKGVKGVRSNYLTDQVNHVFTVFDMQKNDFRRVNLEGAYHFQIRGKDFDVID